MLNSDVISEIEAYIGYIKENKVRRKELEEEMESAKAEVTRVEDAL